MHERDKKFPKIVNFSDLWMYVGKPISKNVGIK